MGDDGCFRLDRGGAVAWLVLNRPEKRNAMGPDFFRRLNGLFRELDEDPGVRAVVIRAEGPAFTAGLDLNALAGLIRDQGAAGRESLRKFILEAQAGMTAVERCRKPVLAAVQGHCLGGGVDLLCACDIRLAARNAVFSVRETRMAMVADLGTLQRLPGIIGEGWCRELVFTGRDFGAGEALKMGFITRMCEDEAALYVEAAILAEQIAENPPLAVQGAKDTIRFTREHGPAAGLEYVAQKNAAILISEDLMEAVQSFMQKRRPVFKGQ